MRAAQTVTQLLLEPRGNRVPTPGQRPDDQALMGIQVIEHRLDDVPQPPGHPVSLDRRSDGPTDHESDPRAGRIGVVAAEMYDDVGLYRPHPSLDRRTELGRSCHAVPRWKHRP